MKLTIENATTRPHEPAPSTTPYPDHTAPAAPEGMVWEYRGIGWNPDKPVWYYCVNFRGYADPEITRKGLTSGSSDFHYFEAVPAPETRNTEFYHGIVTEIGNLFGEETRNSDDGSVQDSVLALKVLEIVARMKKSHELRGKMADWVTKQLEEIAALLAETRKQNLELRAERDEWKQKYEFSERHIQEEHISARKNIQKLLKQPTESNLSLCDRVCEKLRDAAEDRRKIRLDTTPAVG